jgi:hypothetical protein
MRVVICLAAATLVCAAVGCSGGKTDNGNEPGDKPPASLDDQSDRDWLYRSQYKSHMRHLWIDSNRIVSAGRGDLEPTWFEIRASARDIRERAELMGGYWSEIVARGEEVQMCAEDEDRMGASNEFRALGAACDGCHMATWSPAFLHVTSGTIDRWLKNLPTKHGENEQDTVPPPAIPNREAMKRLYFHYSMAEMRIEQWQPQDLNDALSKLLPEAKIRADRWKTVATRAAELEQLATRRTREGMKEAYTTMTNACIACHAEQAGGGREILIPMPWDGPMD